LVEEFRHAKGRRYHFELSLAGIISLAFACVILLGWIFFAGILAGRGLFPDVIKVLVPAEQEKRQTAASQVVPTTPSEPPLAFYSELAKSGEAPPSAEASKDKPPSAISTDDNLYCVQLASLESESKAEQLAKKLRNRGQSAFVTRKEQNGKVMFRVRCGLFASQSEAERLRNYLSQKEGLQGLVVKADSDT
jgi:cell division septation protein DedD